jgi:hypothetical protein
MVLPVRTNWTQSGVLRLPGPAVLTAAPPPMARDWKMELFTPPPNAMKTSAEPLARPLRIMTPAKALAPVFDSAVTRAVMVQSPTIGREAN